MDGKRSTIEVLGVPEVLQEERLVSKLHSYFTKSEHGGGRVVKVLFPCYRPGQAFVVFEEPEVVARVLQKSSHVLEVNHQTYHLKVKAPDSPEVDLPVEATVHLSSFSDQTKVREILMSHDFKIKELDRNRVQITGSFLKLRAAKARLQLLLNSQTQNETPSSSSSPVPGFYSGAIAKYYTKDTSELKGNRSQSGSPSSPTASSCWVDPKQDRRFSPRSESFVVDEDVLRYAQRLREKHIREILQCHNVHLEERPVGDNISITLQGKSAKTAVNKLQSLLNELSESLRTQEVDLKNMDHEGRALLQRIQQRNDIYNSVLVCQRSDALHLIGPSGESYDLKRQLTGGPVDRSGRTGRTADKTSRSRSASVPPLNGKRTERGRDANPKSSPVEARGHSPFKHQDDKHEAAARTGQSEAYGGRSRSESRERARTEKAKGHAHQKENEHSLSSPKNIFTKYYSNWKQKMHDLRK